MEIVFFLLISFSIACGLSLLYIHLDKKDYDVEDYLDRFRE
jgi:hypothetical protein